VEATSAPRTHALRLPKPRRVLAALADDRLVAYVRRGDATAFEVLYDRHSTGVLGFCRHMLGSVQDAEDAVQHSFIAAHADLQRGGEREIHFKAWLYTIARNRCLSMLRARRDQPDAEVELVSDRLTEDVQQRADLHALLADIHRLPPDQREALVLSEVGALSHTEVAEVLVCEVSKVKSLVFQARTALIDRRLARDTSCEDIREQLATLRGGALRRSHLRHHLEACPGCSEYREQVRRQRAMLAIALPVVPSVGLRGDVLAAVGIGGGGVAAGSAGIGGGIALAAKSGFAKFGVAAVIAGGAAGGSAVVATNGGVPGFGGSDATSSVKSERGSLGVTVQKAADSDAAGGSGGASGTGSGGKDSSGGSGKAGTRSESGTEHGFTPIPGESNGERAREFAATRGQGNHNGTTKAHEPTRARRRGAARTKPDRVKQGPVARTRTPKTQPAPRTGTTPKTEAAPKTQPAPKAEPTPTTEPAPATEPAPTVEPLPAETPPPTTPSLGGAGKSVGKSVGR
jgi:RNA polymerase sigma factor (sigma-70 family)